MHNDPQDRIDAYLRGEMTPEEQSAFKRELLTDTSLRQDYAITRGVADELRRRQLVIEQARRWAAENDGAAAKPAGERTSRKWWVAVGAAACLAIAFFAVKPLFQSMGDTAEGSALLAQADDDDYYGIDSIDVRAADRDRHLAMVDDASNKAARDPMQPMPEAAEPINNSEIAPDAYPVPIDDDNYLQPYEIAFCEEVYMVDPEEAIYESASMLSSTIAASSRESTILERLNSAIDSGDYDTALTQAQRLSQQLQGTADQLRKKSSLTAAEAQQLQELDSCIHKIDLLRAYMLIELERYAEARAILTTLANTPGEHQQEARDLLDELP